ncbi:MULTISPECIES: DUF2255 family protein [unclassified Isoptericola]|uniref:DUF2255 family protein n=1 Tax=unclassified Isoptericola TaxID=2623355 RepID=UPI003646E9A4
MNTSATPLPDLVPLAAARSVKLVVDGAAALPTWVVQVGGDLFVRSAPGARWPAGLAAGRGRVRVDGAASGTVERAVVLAEVEPELHGLLDDAYRAKYGACAPERVAEVVSDAAAATTFRIRARRASWGERVYAVASAARARRRVVEGARTVTS